MESEKQVLRHDQNQIGCATTQVTVQGVRLTYDWLAEVGAKAAFVQRGRHELAKGGGLDVALLPQLVQVVLEGEALGAAGCGAEQ
jgi:hypothetical protein